MMTMDACNSQTPSPAACWEMLDGVLVINMDSNTERLERFMAHHQSIFPEGRLHRLSAVAGRQLPGYGEAPWFTAGTGERSAFWGGTAGCALSHRKAIEYAKAQGWRNVLIMEDDAQLVPDAASEAVLTRALRELQGSYMLYLGYNRPTPVGYRVNRGLGYDLWRVSGVLATHSYILPESMYDIVLSYLPTEETVWEWLSVYKAVDVMYRNFVSLHRGVRIYAVYPMMSRQCDAVSDIGQNSMDGAAMSSSEPPRSVCSPAGILRFAFPWLQKIKNELNCMRTNRRAVRGGLPGYKMRKKK